MVKGHNGCLRVEERLERSNVDDSRNGMIIMLLCIAYDMYIYVCVYVLHGAFT